MQTLSSLARPTLPVPPSHESITTSFPSSLNPVASVSALGDTLRFGASAAGKLTIENLATLCNEDAPRLLSPRHGELPLSQSMFNEVPDEATQKAIRNSVGNCPMTQNQLLGKFLVNAMGKGLFDGNVALFNWNKGLITRLLERQGTEVDKKNLLSLNLPKADFLEGKSLNGIDFSRVRLRSADKKPVSLKDCQLRDVKFYLSDMRGLNLEGSNLEGSALADARMQGCNLNWAVINEKTQFKQTHLEGAQLQNIVGWEHSVFEEGSAYCRKGMVPSLYYDRHTVFPKGFKPDKTMCPVGLEAFKRPLVWLKFRNCD